MGLPYDIMGYALTTDAIATSIGCFAESLHVTLAHPHYYVPDEKAIHGCLFGEHSVWTDNVQPILPAHSVERILEDPEKYLDSMWALCACVNYSPYSPKTKLVI